MVHRLICECNRRYEAKINSMSLFEEIKQFFEDQVKKEIYSDVKVTHPYYIWTDGKTRYEYYATKWYKCNICGCLWEFVYPDFPSMGFVKKYSDGIYNGTEFVDVSNDLYNIT